MGGGRQSNREGHGRSEEGWRKQEEDGREGGSGREGVNEGGREGMREGRKVRAGAREEAMMLCRERASVEEERVEGGRIDEGNERGTDGTGYGRPRERGEGGSERRMD